MKSQTIACLEWKSMQAQIKFQAALARSAGAAAKPAQPTSNPYSVFYAVWWLLSFLIKGAWYLVRTLCKVLPLPFFLLVGVCLVAYLQMDKLHVQVMQGVASFTNAPRTLLFMAKSAIPAQDWEGLRTVLVLCGVFTLTYALRFWGVCAVYTLPAIAGVVLLLGSSCWNLALHVIWMCATTIAQQIMDNLCFSKILVLLILLVVSIQSLRQWLVVQLQARWATLQVYRNTHPAFYWTIVILVPIIVFLMIITIFLCLFIDRH